MKRFIVTFCLIILMMCCGCASAQAYTVNVDGIDYTYEDLDVLQEKMDEQMRLMEAAHNMAEAARDLTYDESHDVIILAKDEWDAANLQYEKYQNAYNDLTYHHELEFEEKYNEYPIATTVWRYLTEDLGYNNYVAAGIMGNMMAETGGHTLYLSYSSKANNYYGLCQWSLTYAPNIMDSSLDYQLNYLKSTIETEFNTFGYNYKKHFNYNNFLNLKDYRASAAAFALCYERCDSKTIEVRQRNAAVAYKYFTN